jgi:hypothetical protein
MDRLSIVYGPSAPPRTPPAGAAGKSPCGKAAQEEQQGPQVLRSKWAIMAMYIILTLISDSSRRTAVLSSSIATCLPPLMPVTLTAEHFPMGGSLAMMRRASCFARSTTGADSALSFDSYKAWYVGESRNNNCLNSEVIACEQVLCRHTRTAATLILGSSTWSPPTLVWWLCTTVYLPTESGLWRYWCLTVIQPATGPTIPRATHQPGPILP